MRTPPTFSSISPAPHTLAALDHAFAAWLASDPPTGDINGIINCVGIAFGQTLVDSLGSHWVVATDEFSTELMSRLARSRRHPHFIRQIRRKRWNRGEINFLENCLGRIAQAVRAKQSMCWVPLLSKLAFERRR